MTNGLKEALVPLLCLLVWMLSESSSCEARFNSGSWMGTRQAARSVQLPRGPRNISEVRTVWGAPLCAEDSKQLHFADVLLLCKLSPELSKKP